MSIRSTAFAMLVLATIAFGAESFEDHGGPELDVDGPVLAPIVHEKYFRAERELFGYKPRYAPRPVTFGPDNRPWIWTGLDLITLEDRGAWKGLGVTDTVKAKYTDLLGGISATDPHIGFDANGDMYIVARAPELRRPNIFRETPRRREDAFGFLHSTDRGRTWTFYETPPVRYHGRPFARKLYLGAQRLERLDGHNQLSGPPPMVEGRGRDLVLYVATRKPEGGLNPVQRIHVADVKWPIYGKGRNWITPTHSGAGNVTATFDGRTHVVWMAIQPLNEREEEDAKRFTEKYGLEGLCPVYAATYDHASGKLSERTYLGVTRRDNHNGPVIVADSKGYLHVVIGAHTANFFYLRSTEPNSTASFTEWEQLGPTRKTGYTYTAFVCDGDDNLHLVARNTNSGWFHLVYMRRKAGQSWEPHRRLVTPFRSGYCAWRQKLTVDRLGRLFLTYDYFPAHLRADELEAYRKKWPGDKVGAKLVSGIQPGVRAHSPAMLISDDAGDSWRIALTEDFIAGMQRWREKK
ncbi:MAG: hypothetical protein CMJ18_02935 [Phycisphaeraceae bacterium]|nr:hypothetical protein [Phycisphaeraceae bacterium]